MAFHWGEVTWLVLLLCGVFRRNAALTLAGSWSQEPANFTFFRDTATNLNCPSLSSGCFPPPTPPTPGMFLSIYVFLAGGQ